MQNSVAEEALQSVFCVNSSSRRKQNGPVNGSTPRNPGPINVIGRSRCDGAWSSQCYGAWRATSYCRPTKLRKATTLSASAVQDRHPAPPLPTCSAPASHQNTSVFSLCQRHASLCAFATACDVLQRSKDGRQTRATKSRGRNRGSRLRAFSVLALPPASAFVILLLILFV